MERITKRLLNWASILEDDTRAQAEATAGMPFVFPHVALMPDAHLGKGATVGSVIPTLDAIIPAAVGVDIGCGMIAVRTQHTLESIAGLDRSKLRRAIEAAVPLSPGMYNDHVVAGARAAVAELEDVAAARDFDPGGYAGNWRLQLGTLGGGNHFIEVSADEADRVWLFLHSGSRGVGNRIAQRHITVARELCGRWWIDLPDPDLAYLVDGTDEFWSCIRQMQWAQLFAMRNREEMMRRVTECFAEWTGTAIDESELVNCHHNYTTRGRHFGKEVWLSRKGAIHAGDGVRGLIPGSMGAASFVVTGRGNPLALDSAPHGAGRTFSRSKARKRFTHKQLRDAMAGIEWRDSAVFLDEHPGAYKDIDAVMRDAADLVSVDHTLRQIVNVKGE